MTMPQYRWREEPNGQDCTVQSPIVAPVIGCSDVSESVQPEANATMFFQLAEILPNAPTTTWDLARQLGVTTAVSGVPVGADGRPTADFRTLLVLKERFRQAGIDLQVLETAFPWAHHAKIGGPNAEAEIETCCELIRNMGRVGISVACWNWMAVFNWTRTSLAIPTRGGAVVTGYDHALMANAPVSAEGEVSEETLWANLERFMSIVVPVAEEAGVKLALHPDDPPISPIQGVSRILTSPDAMAKAIDLVPARSNGITFCQGSFATMNADIPAEIARFSEKDAIHFVHFRDVVGNPAKFQEAFHDDGQTDMWAAMRAYKQGGFTGPMRPDHVPTMAGERNGDPGYEVLGRLFAIGYIKGLAEGVEKSS
jgi:mannonate dehydratase